MSETNETMMNLGAWLGRHEAFRAISTRCSAADAECLKAIRDGDEYKQLDMTWEQFCPKHAGLSRVQADRQIHYLEEFGANYFRMIEVMPISPETYRLIAGSVTDEGLEADGERIPLTRENRDKVAAVVTSVREKAGTRKAGNPAIAPLRKRLDALLNSALAAAKQSDRPPELIGLLQEGGESLQRLARRLSEK